MKNGWESAAWLACLVGWNFWLWLCFCTGLIVYHYPFWGINIPFILFIIKIKLNNFK